MATPIHERYADEYVAAAARAVAAARAAAGPALERPAAYN
jgi:hypothetical protein